MIAHKYVFLTLLAAAALAGCAAPEFKPFYLSAKDWRGPELSGHGRLVVGDAVAGASPRTVTLIEIGDLLEAPRDPDRRLRLQEDRSFALTTALERRGVPPENIGVEIKPATGASSEPMRPLVTKPMIVVMHH